MITRESMTLMEKLQILADAAKYDVACTSSGIDRKSGGQGIGNSIAAGICHSFSGDGRCISLLKVLYTNECVYDCKYCLNRASNDIVRASFTPEEISRLTIEFYRRNYIEGLFLSSGVKGSPDETMVELIRSAEILREHYHFRGYIHLKAIPGASPELIRRAGYLADRMSVNLELPTAEGLKRLAPHKSRGNNPAPHETDPASERSEQGRAGRIPPRAAVCPGGAEHADDRRGVRRKRFSDHICGGVPVPELFFKESVLFRVCFSQRGQSAAGPSPGTAASPGTQAVSGGLAAALLRI